MSQLLKIATEAEENARATRKYHRFMGSVLGTGAMMYASNNLQNTLHRKHPLLGAGSTLLAAIAGSRIGARMGDQYYRGSTVKE